MRLDYAHWSLSNILRAYQRDEIDTLEAENCLRAWRDRDARALQALFVRE